MSKALILLSLCLIIGCVQGAGQYSKETIEWINDLTIAKDLAKTQGKPILIDFYAAWCSWCKRMDNDTYADAKVAELAKEFICVKINTDKQPDMAKAYKVRGLPTTAFLNSQGAEIEVIAGYMPAQDFLLKMEKALKSK